MIATPVPDKKTDLLLEAFQTFSAASDSLSSAYSGLQERVNRLAEELEQSNYYLNSVLRSLPCGVLVVDQERMVKTINPAARILFDAGQVEPPFPMARLLVDAAFSDRAAPLMETGSDITEITLAGEPERTLHCAWSRMRDGERVLVVQDITQLRKLEEQMRKTERIAAMGEMAMEVAHEIRNPLGALELFVSLLGEEGISEKERSRYLANIRIGIRSLNTVLTNMLCFKRKPEPDFESLRIREVLQEVTELMDPLLQQRGIRLITDYRDEVKVSADREMIRQIFTNLVTNSLNALSQGGELRIRTHQDKEKVLVEIEDNGIGIPAAFQKKVFSSGFTTRRTGNGLGLSVVQRWMEALNGTIEFESEEGVGTRFSLGFPLEKGE